MRRAPMMITLVAVAAFPATATASQPAAFSGSAAVQDVDGSCLKSGRVVLDVSMRYADAADAAAARYERHRVRSSVSVGGVRDVDRGTAQVAIPSLRSYVHTHRHVLSAAQSRRVLAGRGCGARLRVRVRATQQLSRAGAGSSGVAIAAAQGAAASQSATATVETTAEPATSIPDAINGCLRAGDDWNCHGVNLDGIDLSGETLAYGDFSFASMKNANLQNARLGHVIMNLTVLDGANMQGALLGSASLTSTSLLGADLTGAVASFANLANAKLGGAKLGSANLTATNLHGTAFDNATCDANTLFPAVFPHHCANGLVASG